MTVSLLALLSLNEYNNTISIDHFIDKLNKYELPLLFLHLGRTTLEL